MTTFIIVIIMFILQTKISVRKYNLLKQQLTKKLFTNCRWVSSIAVHPRGFHSILFLSTDILFTDYKSTLKCLLILHREAEFFWLKLT